MYVHPSLSRHRKMNVRADRLVRSSFLLIALSGAMAILGFGFSLVVTRLFTPEQVGAGTSLISATSLIAYLSLLGLNVTIVRFYANSKNPGAQITQSLLVAGGLGLIISGVYVMVVPFYAPALSFVRDNALYAAGFLVAGALSGINLMTDSVFIGARKPEYNLFIDGFVQGITRLVLPVALIGLGAYGIFASVGGGYLVAAVVSILWMRRVLGFRFDFRRQIAITKPQLSYSISSYISNALNTAPIMALPLITVHTLGTAEAGYLFLTFQIAATLYGVSYAIGEALFAEGSFDESRLVSLLKRSGLLLAMLQLPAVIVIAVGSRSILSLFGATYGEHGHHLLQIFAIGAIAVALKTWASALLKLMGLMKSLIASNVVYAGVTIGLAQLWATRGLEWLGWAWLIGNAASGLYAVVAIVAREWSPSGRLAAAGPACAEGGRHAGDQRCSMKIAVINAYVRENGGDAALLSVCLRQVAEAFPGSTISVAGMESPADFADFEGAANLGSITRYVAEGTVSRRTRVVRRVLVATWAVVYLAAPRGIRTALLLLCPEEVGRQATTVEEAHLVVCTGGGYLNGRGRLNGLQNVFFVLLPVLIAQRSGTPVVFGPQSFGPFSDNAQRWLVRRVLNRSQLVVAREEVSVQELRRCGVTGTNVTRGVDSGFAFTSAAQRNWRKELGVGDSEVLVGITARRWLVGTSHDRYERALAHVIDRIQSTPGHRVVLIPQVTSSYLGDDDRLTNNQIAKHCFSDPLIVEEGTHHEDLKCLYESLDMLIGTRFHSVIFALTSRIPCVAIEYEHKTRGIMDDLGLGDWVIQIADVEAEILFGLVQRLEQQRASYRRQLEDVLPGYIARSSEFVGQLRAACRPPLCRLEPSVGAAARP
jgi:colanic acid/amylovoran biosynthesis protein